MPILSRRVPVAIAFAPGHAPRVLKVGGQPALAESGMHLELEVLIEGEPDAATGYLLSIALVDEAVRATLPALLPMLLASNPREVPTGVPAPALFLRAIATPLAMRLGRAVHSLNLALSPALTMSYAPTMPDRALLTRRFDFCAAHRLSLPQLSDEENRALFGKCSHPSGHGHNYRLDVTVAVPFDGAAVNLERWSEVVHAQVVDRYDHRNLNVDCPEFRTLNPSVEHIAKVCHERLLEPLHLLGVELRRVRVWESEKTWCEVP